MAKKAVTKEVEIMEDPASSLNDQHEKFVQEYMKNFHGTNAALAAGYPKASAHVAATRLLKNAKVIARLAELRALTENKADIERNQIINELKLIAFGSTADIIGWDGNEVYLLNKEDMGVAARFIDGITINTTRDLKNNTSETSIKITTLAKEKVKALELLGRHIGMWKDHQPAQQNNFTFIAQWGGTFEPTDGNANPDEPN